MMDRGRDLRYDGRGSGYGDETYRSVERNTREPPRDNSYRAPRSPRRGDRIPPPYRNDYPARSHHADDRPRSRSPRRRSRSPIARRQSDEDGFHGRRRSPPRANDRARSPPLYQRSPRSPRGGQSRARSPFPPGRGRNTTPPEGPSAGRHDGFASQGKPGRHVGDLVERDGYNRRSHPPIRDEPRRFPRENNYRPRERSPTPPRVSSHPSRGETPNSSRRSSPPVHHDRIRPDLRSPVNQHPRYDNPPGRRSPPPQVRARSPPPHRTLSPSRSPHRGSQNWRERTPPIRERDIPSRDREPSRLDVTPAAWTNAQTPGTSYQSTQPRAPPSGPSSRYNSYSREPAPAATPTAPISMPTHARGGPNVLVAPTRPRGGPGAAHESPHNSSHGSGHGSGRGGPRHYNGPSTPRHPSYEPGNNIPTGPRAGSGRGSYDHGHGRGQPSSPPAGPPRFSEQHQTLPNRGVTNGPPFLRTNNSTSTTYPRTQRFNNNSSTNTNSHSTNHHLATLPHLVEGGKKFPSALEPAQERRLAQLEDDKRKLLEAIDEKQRLKRHGLREWEKAERESARDGLRSELAEGHLESLGGEALGGSAY